MSPSAGVAAWRTPPKPLPRRWPKPVLAATAGVLVAMYLAGCFFLWSIHGDPRRATPLTVSRYAYYYGREPHVRRRLLGSCALASVFALVGIGAACLPRRPGLHGDARFATHREIAAAGLLGSEGIILGQRGRRCLMLAGQQGVALAAPPRAGKGVGVGVPNGLNWPGSLVCLDMKRETWTITAGYRASRGQACYLFDPFAEDGRTARWNPLSYVSRHPARRLNDLQRIAEMLYPHPPNVDPFWTASARSLFLGIALYLFETEYLPKTMGEVLRQGMASDAEGFGQHWKRLIEGRNSGGRPLSPECVRSLYDIIDLAPVTASSIRKTFTSRLDLWLNPILDAATAESDFDLRELRKKPMSIYLGVNPNDLHRLAPVFNLFFQQAIGLQTHELPERNPALKYPVMMLLDEFTALGRIPIIAEAISYLPGYNLRVVLVIQTPAQLREVYGIHNAETMLKALAARIVFAPKDVADAREISDELGFTTVPVQTVSEPLSMPLDRRGQRGRSQTVSFQRRALLLPQEVKELGTEEAIILYEGVRPIRCQKIRYFRDRRFRKRLLPTPSAPTPGNPRLDAALAALTSLPPARSCPAASVPVDATGPKPPKREDTVIREATNSDIERIDSLTLDDFAIEFPQVQSPEGEGPMSAEEMQTRVNSFMSTIRREQGEHRVR